MKDRPRRYAVRLLVLLLFVAAAERRLADLDFNAHTESGIENDESVRGQEIRDRLTALHDYIAPRPLLRSEAVVPASAPPVPRPIVRVVFDPESPRAPPAPRPQA